jgi:hypothetical protein
MRITRLQETNSLKPPTQNRPTGLVSDSWAVWCGYGHYKLTPIQVGGLLKPALFGCLNPVKTDHTG